MFQVTGSEACKLTSLLFWLGLVGPQFRQAHSFHRIGPVRSRGPVRVDPWPTRAAHTQNQIRHNQRRREV